MWLRIALSVLPVVLIAGWLSLTSGAKVQTLLLSGAIWAPVTLVAVGICVLLGRAASVQRHPTMDHMPLGVHPAGRILRADHPKHRHANRAAGRRPANVLAG